MSVTVLNVKTLQKGKTLRCNGILRSLVTTTIS